MASKVAITILCAVVALLSGASALLGFIAHTTKLTPDEIRFDESTGVCVYPAKPAYALGICALPLLVAAMVISTVCFSCVKPPHGGSPSWYRLFKAVVYGVLSWGAAVSAMALYVKCVRWNAATTRDAAVAMGLLHLRYGCHYLKGDGFRTAAVLTLVAGALGIMSFTMILTAPAPAAATGAEAEPKNDGELPASDAAPPQAQGQAHAQV